MITGSCLCLLYQYYATLPTVKKTILTYSTKLLLATLTLPLARAALFPILRCVLGESLPHFIGYFVILDKKKDINNFVVKIGHTLFHYQPLS